MGTSLLVLMSRNPCLPLRGRWPRRAGGRELCHCPKSFGLRQVLSPTRCGGSPLPEGAKGNSPQLQHPFPLLIIRQHLRHRGPECRAVVGVGKVTELMHNNVLLRGQRHRAEPPRKRQRAGAQTARPPAGVHVAHRNFGHRAARAGRRKLRIVCPAQRLHIGQCLGLGRQRGGLGGLSFAPGRGTRLCGAHPVGPRRNKGVHISHRHPRRRTGRHTAVGPHAQVDVAHPPPRQRVGDAARRPLHARPPFCKSI